jgi:alpha-1,3-rhamnosyltransferase
MTERVNMALGALGPQQPLVSILVPAFNHEKYVIECLDSIKHLSYPRLELLVSDDCSCDDTFRLASEWAQKNSDRFERVAIVQQEKNLGVVKNIQFLYDSAQGEYLAIIASDDIFVESAIERRVQILCKNSNLDALFARAQFMTESGASTQVEFPNRRVLSMLRKLSSRKLLAASIVLDWPAPGPVLLIRRDATRENGSLGRLPEHLEVEDIYIYVRLASAGKLGFVDEIVSRCRQTPNSHSKINSRENRGAEVAINSYDTIRRQMRGLNRVVLENRLSRYRLQIEKNSAAFYGIRSLLLRAVTAQLKLVILIICMSISEPTMQH